MTRKLSAITTAKVAILSETTKQMTEKASHASRAEGSKSSFNYEIVLIEALKLLRRQPGGGLNGYTVAGAGMLLVAAWHVIHDKTDYVDFQKQDRQSPASNG